MTLTFARFDLISWMPRKQTLIPLLLIVAVGIVLPIPGMAIIAAAFVASLSFSVPFLGDERSRLDTLYGLLPVSRRVVVVGRVTSLLVYYVIAAVVATAVTLAMTIVRGDELPADVLVLAHAAAFAIVGLSAGLQLPVLFRIGYSRGRLIAYAPTFVLAGLAWIGQATGALEPFQEALTDASVLSIAGGGLLFGAAGVVAGAVLAVRAYRRREL